jgi:hypothetical protein
MSTDPAAYQDEKAAKNAAKGFFKSIRLGLVDKIRTEVARGFDLRCTYDNGFLLGETTPLNYALNVAPEEVALLLLELGADATLADPDGWTPLHVAETRRLAEALVARGADVHARDHGGTTPLHRACLSGGRDLALVEYLLEQGVPVDVADDNGRTPYQYGSQMRVRELLRKWGSRGLPHTEGRSLAATQSEVSLAEVRTDRGCLAVDGGGNVWFWGYTGMFRYDGERVVRFDLEGSFAVSHIAKGARGDVYFATNAGLLRYRDGDFRLFSADDSDIHESHLTYLTTDPAGRAYAVSYEGEREHAYISVFDGEGFSLLRSNVDFPSGLDITCLAFEADGTLMIGTRMGLARKLSGRWRIEKKFGKSTNFDTTVYDITIDDDTLWLGTSDGVYRIVAGRFENFDVGLAHIVCWDGTSLWAGTYFDGLARIRDGEVAKYQPDDSELPHEDVQGLALGPDGTLWIQANDDVAYVRDGVIGRLKPKAASEPESTFELTDESTLRPLPAAPLLPRTAIPADIIERFEAARLAGITVEGLASLVRPGIGFDLAPSDQGVPIPIGASKFGGTPDLPEGLDWPTFDDDEDESLPFLLQVNLADVHEYDVEGLLPAEGMLYFFSDTQPDELDDGRVLYADTTVDQLARRALPESLADRTDEDDFIAELPEYLIVFGGCFTLPSNEFIRDRAELTDADEDTINELRDYLRTCGDHEVCSSGSRLLGWPDNMQGEFLDSVKDIALLQLRGYALAPKGIEKVFRHWCSDGLIHFITRRGALRKRRFAKVGVSMQYT